MSTKPAKKKTPYQDAASDINAVLKPDPLLDVKANESAIKAELVELLPSIKEGDDLVLSTWKTLKVLGWKETKTPVKKAVAAKGKKAKAPKEAGEPRYTRAYAIIDAIRSAKSLTHDALVKRSDELFCKKTGKDANLKQSEHVVAIMEPELAYCEFIKVEGAKITLA